jgi:hypothetical protein
MRILITFAVFAALSFGQNRFVAEGRLIGAGIAEGLTIEVSEGSGKTRMPAVPVHADASFRIELPSEERTLEFRVLNRYGEVIQTISYWPMRGASLELRLTPRPSVVSSGQNAVSFKRLAFQPSAKMRRAFTQARKLSASGKQTESLAAMQEIVKTEPGWFEAWEELGKLQAILGAHSAAAGSLQQALAIDPNAATVYSSLGMALVRTRRFSEARQIAQKGLDLNPDCVKSKYVLGLAMASTRQSTARAVTLLEEVQSHFPEAMVPLAALLLVQGQFEASRDAAWRYLHIGRAPRAELAQSIWREASGRLK